MTTNEILQATITAYCACTKCCGPKAADITASEKAPIAGITIAVPRSIPLGSRITIGAHAYIAQDRTARRFDGRFDIYFATHKEALRFGKQTNKVTIITHDP